MCWSECSSRRTAYLCRSLLPPSWRRRDDDHVTIDAEQVAAELRKIPDWEIARGLAIASESIQPETDTHAVLQLLLVEAAARLNPHS